MKINVMILLFAVTTLTITSCKKDVNVTPKIDSVDPGQGAGNALITITGSGLQNITHAVLDLGNVPIALNSNFNTSTAILLRVPVNANVGAQHIVFTNSSGFQYSLPFTVLSVPSITSAIPMEWQQGSEITLNGNYFDKVYHVAIANTADTATILSKTATKLVLKMPKSNVASAKLVVFNDAGATTTDIVFINMDNNQQLKFFTEDFGSGMQNWSWCSAANSTDFAISGTTSLKAIYADGGYQGLSFHYDNPIAGSAYDYLAFWIKGGSNAETINVAADAVIDGSPKSTKITVPATVWTYFKIPVSGNFDNSHFQRLNFQIDGPAGTETLYFDDVLFVKP